MTKAEKCGIINIEKECMLMNGKMNMSISQIFQKDGKPTAFVLFSEGRKSAEGKIPDCTIISNDGFSEKEVKALELYLKMQQESILKTAKEVNIMKAFMQN
mgnify:FL=1